MLIILCWLQTGYVQLNTCVIVEDIDNWLNISDLSPHKLLCLIIIYSSCKYKFLHNILCTHMKIEMIFIKVSNHFQSTANFSCFKKKIWCWLRWALLGTRNSKNWTNLYPAVLKRRLEGLPYFLPDSSSVLKVIH